jgi:glutathione S-transferase
MHGVGHPRQCFQHTGARQGLGGVNFGPLDAYSLTLTRWGSMAGIDPLDFPDLWTFVQRVAHQSAVTRVIERERLQLNLFKPT